MKSYFYKSIIFIIFFSIFNIGCEEGFDELNTSDIDITSLDPVAVFNRAMIETSPGSFGRSTLVYEIPIVQQMLTPFGVSLAGGNYNQDNRAVTADIWNNYYGQVFKNLVDVINRTSDDPERSNLYNMARIWRALAGMILTDTYGDVPFSEAGKGFTDGVVSPGYDTQENIYTTILSELEQATASLDPNKGIERSEIMYNGNIEQWRRLGNSIMLRAAMRLVKVAPDVARQYVTQAAQGGTMQSNEDNAVIRHTLDYTNSIGTNLNGSEAANFYLTRYFVDYMQENNDPRLASIAIRYKGATSGNEQTPDVATQDPSEQIGIPIGYDNTSIGPAVAEDGLVSFYEYSQLNRNWLGKQDAPQFLVTYAQTQLLLAEAAHRGWISDQSAEEYFHEGIRAHMNQMAIHDVNAAINESEIDQYIMDHPLESGNELEQINTQYWMASFLNGPEAFANFRRSGYPDLEENPYPQSDFPDGFIRRLTYPLSEFDVNLQNVDEAVERQGPDNLTVRVWWDVE